MSGGTLNLRYNRIMGNGADAADRSDAFTNSSARVNAEHNWWGCSAGPSNSACDRVTSTGGSLTSTPWLRDRLTSSMGMTLVTNMGTDLTASFLTNSSGTDVPVEDLARLIGQSVTWGATSGVITIAQTSIQASGTATGEFYATGVGTSTIYARVDNDATSGASSNVLSLTIIKANTITAITSDLPDPSAPGGAVTVSATVTGMFGNAPTAPGGTVTVTDGVDSCTITLPAASCALTLDTIGERNLTATYGGDDNFNGSTSSIATHTVNQVATTTAITSDTPDPSVVGQVVTFSYTVSAVPPGAGTPTGDVTVSNGSQECTGTVAAGNCTITFSAPGTTNFTATYEGDTNYSGSTSSIAAHTVNQAATTTTITSDTPDPSVVGQVVTFSYTVSVVPPGAGTPTGNVTVSNGSQNCTGTVAAGSCTITFSAPDVTNFTASYEGIPTSMAALRLPRFTRFNHCLRWPRSALMQTPVMGS